MKKKLEDIKNGAKVLIYTCGNVKSGDEVLIIVDSSTLEVGEYLSEIAKEITDNVKIMLAIQEDMHGVEPADDIAHAMMEADVIFGATSFSLAHTRARINATNKGARYLSLPDYSIEQLSSPALIVDFFQRAKIAEKIKDLLDSGKKIKVITQKGTDINLNISGRLANYCPGFCNKPGMLGSPPDIETNIAPVEDESNGILVVDGSIPCKEIGLITEDMKFKIEYGSIINIDIKPEKIDVLHKLLDTNPKKRVLAEFGIGLNPKATLCGRMLEDEGCLGTIHFGFGSNATIGGKNNVNFHLDFVIRNPTVIIDETVIMEKGNLLVT